MALKDDKNNHATLELDIWDDELNTKLLDLQSLISTLEKTKGLGKANILLQCQEKLKKTVNSTRRSFAMELRSFNMNLNNSTVSSSNFIIKQKYQAKLEAFDKKIDELKGRMAWQEKEVLMGNAANSNERFVESGGMKLNDDTSLDLQQARSSMLDATNKVQNKTEESLGRSLKSAYEMNEVGAATLEKMEAQTQQIGNIKDKVDEMDNELKKAGELIKGMLRRIMTDKLILFFVGIIFLAVIALVIYIAVRPSKTSSGTSISLTPST